MAKLSVTVSDFGGECDVRKESWERVSQMALTLALTLNCSCVTLDKDLPLPGPQFPHLKVEGLAKMLSKEILWL